MNKILAITLILCSIGSCKNSSDSVVKDMADYKEYEEKFVGLTADSSLQWARYETLVNKSSESELLSLCDNESPVVRCYAFQALTNRNSSKIFNVLSKHISDTAEFDRTTGCSVGPCYVTDFFLEQVGYFPHRLSSNSITIEQKNFLDSLMLFSSEITLRRESYNEIRLRSRELMLQDLVPKENYYTRLREITSAGVIEALPALSKFKNQNDIIIIKTISENEGLIGEKFVLEAIVNFPHPDLFFIIEDQVKADLRHDNMFNFVLYKALVQFKTLKARKLLEEAISKFNEQSHEMAINKIRFLIEEYQAKMFKGLLFPAIAPKEPPPTQSFN